MANLIYELQFGNRGVVDLLVLGSIVKPMNACSIALLNDFGFGVQPMLHIVALRRACVHIGEIRLSRHLVRAGREINSALVKVRHWRSRQSNVGSGRRHGFGMFHGKILIGKNPGAIWRTDNGITTRTWQDATGRAD